MLPTTTTAWPLFWGGKITFFLAGNRVKSGANLKNSSQSFQPNAHFIGLVGARLLIHRETYMHRTKTQKARLDLLTFFTVAISENLR